MLRFTANYKIQEKIKNIDKWGNIPKQFIWNSTSALDFKHAFNESFIKEKIDYFLAENFDHSLEGIEKANNTLTNITLAAAKVSLPTKET